MDMGPKVPVANVLWFGWGRDSRLSRWHIAARYEGMWGGVVNSVTALCRIGHTGNDIWTGGYSSFDPTCRSCVKKFAKLHPASLEAAAQPEDSPS